MPVLPPCPTLTIDDPEDAGSEPGSLATAIAHTPHLAAQCVDGQSFTTEIDAND